MNKEKSLQYILKNLKYLHFQQKNHVQSSVLTYPIKDFLKKPPSTNFIPFFPLDCSSSYIENTEEDKMSKDGIVQTTSASGSNLPPNEYNLTNVSYYSPYFLNKFDRSTAPPKETDSIGSNSATLSFKEQQINKWFDSLTKESKFKSSKEDLTKIFTVTSFKEQQEAEPEEKVTREEDSPVVQKNNRPGTPGIGSAIPRFHGQSDDFLSKENSADSNPPERINSVQYMELQEKVPLVKYSKLHELKLVTISIASPEKIKEWAEKTLPNGKVFGEVTNANTLHYKTFKPHKGGLFCERIFGPLKDFECACGIYSKPNELESKKILQHEQIQRTFCPNCDVEYTWSVIRRYQLGYIQLVSPVCHIWYLKANPSYLSLLLDFKRSFLESIIYCTQSITLENLFKKSEKNLFDASPKNLYSVWQKLIKEEKFINGKIVNMERGLGGLVSMGVFPQRGTAQSPAHQTLTKLNKTPKSSLQKKTQIKTLKIQKRFKIAKLKNFKTFKFSQLGSSVMLRKSLFWFKPDSSVVLPNNRSGTDSYAQEHSYLFHGEKLNQTKLQSKFNYSIYAINNIFIYVIRSLDYVQNLAKNADINKSPFLPLLSRSDQQTKFKNVVYSKKNLKTNFSTWNSRVPDLLFFRTTGKLSSVKFSSSKPVFIQNFNFKVNDAASMHPQNFTIFSFSDNNFLLKNYFNFFYFKKIYSEILQTKEKIRSEILFSNFTNLSKFKTNFKNKLLLRSSLDHPQPSDFGSVNQNFFLSKVKTKNFKKSLVQNSVLISFIRFFFLKRNLNSNKNKNFFETMKDSDKLLKESFNLTELSSMSVDQQAYILSLLNTQISNRSQKFLKQVFCLSFFNEKFSFVKLNSSNKNQIQNWFYTFFLNLKLTSMFCPKDISFSLVWLQGLFNQPHSNISLSKMNKTLKIFYYTSGLKLTKKIQKVSSILKKNTGWANAQELISQEFWAFAQTKGSTDKENFTIYNHLKRKKSFRNLKLVYFFFEIFCLPFLNSSSVSQSVATELNNAKQLGETNFFAEDVTSSANEIKLEYRKKALFLKKQKEIQFQKLSNLFNQKTGRENAVRHTDRWNVSPPKVMQQLYKGSEQKRAEIQTSEKNFVRSFRKNLKNPLYTVSYFYPWPSELDWKSFMYYNSENLFLQDKPIAFYKNGSFQKFSEANHHQLSEEHYEKNNQLTETLTGASLIQKLLTELDSTEFQKMIKQHQILIPIVNRSIRKLTKKLSQSMDENKFGWVSSEIEFPEASNVGTPLLHRQREQTPLPQRGGHSPAGRPKLAQTKSDFLKIQKLLQKRDHIIRRFKFLSKISWSGGKLHSSSFPSDTMSMGGSASAFPSASRNPMGEGTKIAKVQQKTNPTSMILTVLPVLPPDLRPILKLQNQIAASDLNRLYQRIIYRNERLKKFLKDPSTSQSFEMKYAQRLLQEAVDNLIENGKGSVKPETNARGQALKSLSEILKGKQGRFRQYLLGKRVDYSGRSVIVVGPSLKLSECGLPLRIAIELFLPFLIKKILHYKLAKTVIGAKNFIYSNNSFTWNLLNEIMKNHPILLNRAPTLHRLGIQAFLPKLIHGQAILLHPLVCPAFNADFDGDQMAVHVPITVEARTEAWSFLFSRNHLLSAATGEPIILPSQDMVLGCYYLTSENSLFKSSTSWSIAPQFRTSNWSSQKKSKSNQKFYPTSDSLTRKGQLISQLRFQRKCFYNWDSVLNAYQKNQILLQSVIWVRWNGKTEFPNESFSPLEIRINSFGHYEKIKSKLVLSFKPSVKKPYLNQLICNQYIRTTPGRVLINNVIQNCMRF